MHIVQLITRRQRRGAEVFAAELSARLAARGHTVRFVGLVAPPEEALAPEGAVSEDLTPLGRPGWRVVRPLIAYLRAVRPDVVQANGGNALEAMALARRFGRLPVPVVYRNIGVPSDWVRFPGQRRWTRWLLRGVDAVASVGQAGRDDLVAHFGVPPDRVQVVRRGVATAGVVERSEGRKRLREAGVPEAAPVLVHVGSFTPEKNHEGLLRIVAQVRTAHPEARLVLIGDGPGRAALALPPWVHALGVRPDVPALLAGADVLVLPSRSEGVPGVVLEAAVQGVPSVAYDVGGVAEAIRDGETGAVVAPGDEAAAAQAAIAFLSDERLRSEAGRAARTYAERHFGMERAVDAFEALYEALVPRPREVLA